MTRPIIGSAWRPHRYSYRSPIEYRELRPHVTGDDATLQRALIERRRADCWDGVIGRVCAALLVLALAALAVGWL